MSPVNTAVKTALRSAKRVFHLKVFLIMERELDVDLDESEPRIPVEFRFAIADDAEALCVAEHGQVDEESLQAIRERFALGHTCLAAFDGEEVASFSWSCTSGSRMDGPLDLVLGSGWAQYYKAYTSKDHRGHGLQKALMRRQFNDLRHKRFERVFLFVSVRNGVARNNYEKLMTVTGKVYEFHLFSRFRFTFGPGGTGQKLGSPTVTLKSEVSSAP